jgi:hypothetical protein
MSDTDVVTKLRTNKLAVYLIGGGFGGLAVLTTDVGDGVAW